MIIANVIHYFYDFNFFLLMGHHKYMALGIRLTGLENWREPSALKL